MSQLEIENNTLPQPLILDNNEDQELDHSVQDNGGGGSIEDEEKAANQVRERLLSLGDIQYYEPENDPVWSNIKLYCSAALFCLGVVIVPCALTIIFL